MCLLIFAHQVDPRYRLVLAANPELSRAQVLRIMQKPKPPARQPIDDLTRREEDILKGVAAGKSNKEIGRDLDIQEKTVKHYMTIILSKLQARNRVEAALIAQEAWRKK